MIDLTFEDVENAGTCGDRIIIRVVGASKETIGLELLGCVTPLLSLIIDHVFSVLDGNVESLQRRADSCDSGVRVFGA